MGPLGYPDVGNRPRHSLIVSQLKQTVTVDFIEPTFFHSADFPIIMETVWNRMSERDPKYWRYVYKSLILLNYLICNGSKQVVE